MSRLETLLALTSGLLAGVIVGWLAASNTLAKQLEQAERAQAMEGWR